MNLINATTCQVKNFAVLMFSRTPENFIPYSFVELIYRSRLGETMMQSKEYRGPIWKQLKNVMDDIKNRYIHSITLRVKNEVESSTIYNYPYSTVEELVTNAIVHKNYENPRTVQIYIYDDSIVITNYNNPIPPVTIHDLNELEAFPNRSYENHSIREMFKALDYIESYGSGIGKAKRAMQRNGSERFHFEEYDENIEITSVRIPINKEYVRFQTYDQQESNLDIPETLPDRNQIKEMESVKINTIDCIEIIKNSDFSDNIKNTLLDIYKHFFNDIFGRKDLIDYLKVSNASGTNYINHLLNLNVIEPVKGNGKGRYRFI